MEDKEFVKEAVKECFENFSILHTMQFNNIEQRLEKIETQLKQINGIVQRHEIEIGRLVDSDEIYKANRIHTCPQLPVIRNLEDNALEAKVIRKHIWMSMVAAGIIMGLIVSFFSLINLI